MQTDALARTSNLIGSLYEAALDDSLWDDVIRDAATMMQADTGIMYSLDVATSASSVDAQDGGFTALHGFDAKAVQSFAEHYTFVKVWHHAEEFLTEGTAVTSSMLYPDALLPNTEWYNDWLRPHDLFYALGGVVVRNGSVASKVSLLRSQACGAYDDDDLIVWQTVVHHMRRAVELRRRALPVDWTTSGAFAALDMLPQGVVLVSTIGRLLFRNLRAEALLTKRRGLSVDVSGSLRATTGGHDAELQRLLREAIAAGTRAGVLKGDGALRVVGEAGTLQLFVAPLPARSDRFDLQRGAVAVFITDPAERPVAFQDTLMALYKMTPAEAQLTAALASGESLAEYGTRRELAITTLRTHLAAASAKAGAKRQADLVRMVLTGPAVFQISREPK